MSGANSYVILLVAVVRHSEPNELIGMIYYTVHILHNNAGGRPAVRGGPAQQDTVNHVRTER